MRRKLLAVIRYGIVFYAGWIAAFLSALYASKGPNSQPREASE